MDISEIKQEIPKLEDKQSSQPSPNNADHKQSTAEHFSMDVRRNLKLEDETVLNRRGARNNQRGGSLLRIFGRISYGLAAAERYIDANFENLQLLRSFRDAMAAPPHVAAQMNAPEQAQHQWGRQWP